MEMDQLNTTIKMILENSSPYAYSFITFVKRSINQFNLGSRLEVGDVIAIAYDRTRTAIANGKEIDNMLGWLKSTSYNIIREQSRCNQKEKPTDPQQYILVNIVDISGDQDVEDPKKSIFWLVLALNTLKSERPNDFRLIHYYYFEQKSYREISSQHLLGEDLTPSALRKRMSRALKLLREIYHASLNV